MLLIINIIVVAYLAANVLTRIFFAEDEGEVEQPKIQCDYWVGHLIAKAAYATTPAGIIDAVRAGKQPEGVSLETAANLDDELATFLYDLDFAVGVDQLKIEIVRNNQKPKPAPSYKEVVFGNQQVDYNEAMAPCYFEPTSLTI